MIKKVIVFLLLLGALPMLRAEVSPFPLSSVSLAPGSKWHANQQLDSAWMCSLEVKMLLHSFRTTAGVWSANEGGYSGTQKIEKLGGWESLDCDLRGHTTGHLLSAYALMYANTGSSIFKLKGDSIVDGLRECQLMMGSGYLSAYPEGLLKRNLQGKPVWAPWYTIHKLLAGLILQYSLAGNETALKICNDFTDWACKFLSEENLSRYIDGKATTVEEVRQRAIRNEFGGAGEAFFDLYQLTGNEKDLYLCKFFYHNDKMDPLYAGNFDMGTMHTNTFLPKVLCEAKRSEEGRAMANAFWHDITAHHVLAPGCLSDKEHFFNPAETSKHLTGNTGETCCTYNMLKLTRELYSHAPFDGAYFDYYERALFNHILGQQDPATGRVHYFLPTATGAYKLYSTYDRSFWCCVGSAFESHAKYAESIYWHNKDSLFVNLFIPSVVTWKDKGITLKQETTFPESETTTLYIKGGKCTLMLRIPSWCKKPSVYVDGRKQYAKNRNGYVAVSVEKDCKVALTLSMMLRLEATPDDPQRAALFYGPVLLAGQLGIEGIDSFFSDPLKHNDYYGYDYHIPENLKSVTLDTKGLVRTGSLTWRTSDGIEIRPLYDTHRQRYVVYWILRSTDFTQFNCVKSVLFC